MDWLTSLRGAVVGLDTAPLIYYVEAHSTYSSVVDPLFAALARKEFKAVTSIISLAEVLVHPIRSGDISLADEYRALLLDTNELTTFPVSQAIAERTARLRSTYRIRTPDALQLATAIEMGATTFVTNDDRLPAVPGIAIVVLKNVLHSSKT